MITGKWNYYIKKKNKWVEFHALYTAKLDGDYEEYPHELFFDQVEFRDNQMILMGDTCHDGCVIKAVFEKNN